MTKVRAVHSGCWAAAGVARASVIAPTSRCDNKAAPARLRACAPARLPACLLCYTRPGLRHQPNTIFLPVCLPACLRLQEYADFLKQVEMESTAAAAELAHDEEAEAAGRLDREDFEQL